MSLEETSIGLANLMNVEKLIDPSNIRPFNDTTSPGVILTEQANIDNDDDDDLPKRIPIDITPHDTLDLPIYKSPKERYTPSPPVSPIKPNLVTETERLDTINDFLKSNNIEKPHQNKLNEEKHRMILTLNGWASRNKIHLSYPMTMSMDYDDIKREFDHHQKSLNGDASLQFWMSASTFGFQAVEFLGNSMDSERYNINSRGYSEFMSAELKKDHYIDLMRDLIEKYGSTKETSVEMRAMTALCLSFAQFQTLSRFSSHDLSKLSKQNDSPNTNVEHFTGSIKKPSLNL